MDSKAVEKEVLDKLAREEKENDRLWANIEAKDREIRHLKGYQSQTVDLAKQVAELERNKKELETRLMESKKATGNSKKATGNRATGNSATGNSALLKSSEE